MTYRTPGQPGVLLLQRTFEPEETNDRARAHHDISENADTTEPAKLLAIFVIDSKVAELTIIEGQ
ncbi:MAG TPA: hypothetical protein VNH44_15660 [Micropepsaceae bacterium]|nr:hypothetical protein [Micropepsaceae bacterium]